MEDAVKTTLEPIGLRCNTDIETLTKTMILAMQGSWLTRNAHTWQCVESTNSGDAPVKYGRLTKQRVLDYSTGLTRYMYRNETFSSQSMYPIAVWALNTEHLLLIKAEMLARTIPGIVKHGCIVDGLILKGGA
jgi:hypothetical protein